MAFSWAAWAVVLLVRIPPSPASCPPANERERWLVDRATLNEAGLEGLNPFDLAIDPDDGAVYLSFQSGLWSLDAGGAIGVIDARKALRTTALPERDCTRYADQIALDSGRRRLYVLTSGLGRYCLNVFATPSLDHLETIALGGEAKWPVIVEDHLVILYWPATAEHLFKDVVAQAFSLDGLELAHSFRVPPDSMRPGEPSVLGGDVLFTALTDGLYRLDVRERSLDRLEEEEIGFALGLAAWGDPPVFYLARPLSWTVERRSVGARPTRVGRRRHALVADLRSTARAGPRREPHRRARDHPRR